MKNLLIAGCLALALTLLCSSCSNSTQGCIISSSDTLSVWVESAFDNDSLRIWVDDVLVNSARYTTNNILSLAGSFTVVQPYGMHRLRVECTTLSLTSSIDFQQCKRVQYIFINHDVTAKQIQCAVSDVRRLYD